MERWTDRTGRRVEEVATKASNWELTEEQPQGRVTGWWAHFCIPTSSWIPLHGYSPMSETLLRPGLQA